MPAGGRSKADRPRTVATSAGGPMSGLSSQERADLAGVGFPGGAQECALRSRGLLSAVSPEAETSDVILGPHAKAVILPSDRRVSNARTDHKNRLHLSAGHHSVEEGFHQGHR